MNYLKLLMFIIPLFWLSPLRAQHLFASPSFCGGQLCIGAGRVVSGDKLNDPSYYFRRAGGFEPSVYIVKYKDFGRIDLSIKLVSEELCAELNEPPVGPKKGDGGITYSQEFCEKINGKAYLIAISLLGFDAKKARDLCSQAFSGLWGIDSDSVSVLVYKPTYNRINFDLDCSN